MFYDKFIQLCAERGESPSLAAENMGFKRSVVTRWGHGTVPRDATIQRVANYFNVPVSTFTQQKTPPTNEVDGIDEDLLNSLVKLNPGDVEKVRAYIQGMLDKSEA